MRLHYAVPLGLLQVRVPLRIPWRYSDAVTEATAHPVAAIYTHSTFNGTATCSSHIGTALCKTPVASRRNLDVKSLVHTFQIISAVRYMHRYNFTFQYQHSHGLHLWMGVCSCSAQTCHRFSSESCMTMSMHYKTVKLNLATLYGWEAVTYAEVLSAAYLCSWTFTW